MKYSTKGIIGVLIIMIGTIITLITTGYTPLIGLLMMLIGMSIATYNFYVGITSKMTEKEKEEFAKRSSTIIIASS